MNLKVTMMSERRWVSKSYMLHDSIYMIFSKRQNHRDGESISCQGLKVSSVWPQRKSIRVFYWLNGMVLFLTVVDNKIIPSLLDCSAIPQPWWSRRKRVSIWGRKAVYTYILSQVGIWPFSVLLLSKFLFLIFAWLKRSTCHPAKGLSCCLRAVGTSPFSSAQSTLSPLRGGLPSYFSACC